MSFVASLYARLLDHQELPVQVQWRALRIFELEKNEGALAKLAAHPALDTEIDVLLAKHNNVKVRAQWASRPGRDLEQLKAAFSKEKRITMLEIGVQLKDMPDDWYVQMMRTPSWKVAKHIVINRAIGLDVRKQAATIHAAAFHEGRWRDALNVVYSSAPELHDALASGAHGARDVLQYVAGSELSLGNQRAVLDHGIYPYFLAPSAQRYGQYEIDRKVEGALQAAIAFGRQPQHDESLRRELLARLEAYDMAGFDNRFIAKRVEALDVLKGDPLPVIGSLALASMTTDLEQLEAFLTEANTERDYELAAAAASNPHITVELLETALRCVNYGGRRELMQAHRSSSDLFALLLQDGWEYGDEVLERADDPAAVLEKYIMRVSTTRAGIPTWTMSSKYMKLEMLERTPFHVLAGAELSEQLRGQLLELITTALGDSSDEAWALFESVANSSGASLGDVIAATAALTTPG